MKSSARYMSQIMTHIALRRVANVDSWGIADGAQKDRMSTKRRVGLVRWAYRLQRGMQHQCICYIVNSCSRNILLV